MKFQVLLSSMNETDWSLIHTSNLDKIDCLVINQCETEHDFFTENENHRMYHTPTRGLSVSRNLAIRHSEADICLFSDNDEVFCSDLEQVILSTYAAYPNADLIIFRITNYPTKLGRKAKN